MRKLRKRLARSLDTASNISARLWMAQEVPDQLCIKQGAIVRRWRELQSQLGGCVR